MSKGKVTICLGFVIIILTIMTPKEHTPAWTKGFMDTSNESTIVFLSDEYFAQLDQLFKQVKSENDQWHIFDDSKRLAAIAVITRMMTDLEDNPTALKTHENSTRYFETFDKNVRRLNALTEEIHFFRNTLNTYCGAPTKLDEMITLAAVGEWRLFSSKYHKYNSAEGVNAALNVKFVSANGRFEAVYNTGTGEIVTDPVNMGTYNYAPGSINPIQYVQHFTFDKIPWKKWGNVKDVPYKDIIRLESKHGSDEANDNARKIKQMIEQRKAELK